MVYVILSQIKQLVAVIALIVVCVAMIAMIIFLAVVKNSQFTRQHKLTTYKAKYEKLYNDIYGIDYTYLKRLNNAADVNPTYESLFLELSPIYGKITRTLEPGAKYALDTFERNISASYKEYKNALEDLKTVFVGFEKTTNYLTQRLIDQFTAEEKLKDWIANLNKIYDRCRYLFEISEQSLQILSETFFTVFDAIDEQFDQINDLIETAKYEEANNIITKLDKMIGELKDGLENLPALCIEATETVPDLIEKVERKCEEMNEQKIPVHHLHVSSTLNTYNNVIQDLIKNFNNFVYKNARSTIDEMINGLNVLLTQFDQEYESAQLVESDCSTVYSQCSNLENSFISLKRSITKVEEYYKISSSYDGYIDKIQDHINELGNLKRQLDAYVLSSTKQPYSMLVNKMKELSSKCNDVRIMIDEFNKYIDSLKKDCEKSYSLINEAFMSVKHCEYLLRELNLKEVSEPQRKTIDRIYLVLDRLNSTLMTVPIDVATVNRHTNEIISLNTGLKEFVNTVISQAIETEKNIVLANKERPTLGTFNTVLQTSEAEFFKGNFAIENQNALAVLQKTKRQ